MKNNWFEIKAQADAAEAPVEAFIYDEVGGWGVSAGDFIAALQPYKDKAITLRINSPGGNVFDGLAIYNYLRGLNVTTRVDGIAASMASIIALAGKRVEIASNGFFMVHRPAVVAIGTSDDMEDAASLLDKLEDTLSAIYQRETGATAEQVKKWMNDETWFTGAEAKEAGLADELTDEIAFSAKADGFKKAPAALTAVDSARPSVEAKDKSLIDTLKAILGISPAAPAPAPEPTPTPEAKVDPELIQARADLATAKTTIGTLEAKVIALEGDLKTAHTATETAKAEAAKAASVKAAEITASQGQPPIAVAPTDKPAATKPDVSKLTGLEKAIAAHKASLETK